MSIDARYYTNGEKTAYIVIHTDTGEIEEYERLDDIPNSVRHFFRKKTDPKYIEPDMARIMGVKHIFYPEWNVKCGFPAFDGFECIAESCGVHGETCWKDCKYMKW